MSSSLRLSFLGIILGVHSPSPAMRVAVCSAAAWSAAHCIKDAARISIKGISEEEWKGAHIIESKNTALDLCALLFATDILPGAKRLFIAEGDILDEVIVVGYPNVPGFTELIAVEKAEISSRITVSKGTIASRATDYFSGVELFLITAPVRAGFSGGPVIGNLGQVLGVLSRLSDSESDSSIYDRHGYGTAIPSNEIKRLLLALEKQDETLLVGTKCDSIEYFPWPESDLGADEAQPEPEEV